MEISHNYERKGVAIVMYKVAWVLLIIGGLNWLLIGLGGWNVVDYLGMTVARVVYVLVGLSALYLLFVGGKKMGGGAAM